MPSPVTVSRQAGTDPGTRGGRP